LDRTYIVVIHDHIKTEL